MPAPKSLGSHFPLYQRVTHNLRSLRAGGRSRAEARLISPPLVELPARRNGPGSPTTQTTGPHHSTQHTHTRRARQPMTHPQLHDGARKTAGRGVSSVRQRVVARSMNSNSGVAAPRLPKLALAGAASRRTSRSATTAKTVLIRSDCGEDRIGDLRRRVEFAHGFGSVRKMSARGCGTTRSTAICRECSQPRNAYKYRDSSNPPSTRSVVYSIS
jgi:hypothetical protein